MQRMVWTPVVASELGLAEEWAGRDIEEGNVHIPFPEDDFSHYYWVDLVVSVVLYVLSSMWSVWSVRTTIC